MTIIKQQSVTGGTSHQKNLRNYINNDEKVLLRESQNMDMCSDIKQWSSFMESTREMFGHNKASRKGKDGKEAKNTILYHQILGFNPDECDINGGKLSPQACMKYAQEYAATYYPNHEIVFALHNEYCKEDKTHRYAVHMVINRSNLKTGKRLDEGLGVKAKTERAKRIRAMDEAWGLKQVEEGKINSTTHHKQPSRVEKEIEKNGNRSYKTNLRELLRIAAQRTDNLVEFRNELERWGVKTDFRNGRMYATDVDNPKYSFSVLKLDAELRPYALDPHGEYEKLDTIKNNYLQKIQKLYQDYQKELHSLGMKKLKELPEFKIIKTPPELANNTQLTRKVLTYVRNAEQARRKHATDAPTTPHNYHPTSNTTQETQQRHRQQQTYSRPSQSHHR